jgi:ABC-type glycerol-3-phosphate transport system substrate-binding protein
MRKFSFVLTFLMVMALLLAACGGEAPAAAPADSGCSDTAPRRRRGPQCANAAEPTPVVSAFGQCDDPMVLMHGLTGADGAVFADMLQQYADANPEAVSKPRAFRGISSSRSILHR